MITVRRSIVPDVSVIARDMRPEDRDEVWAAAGVTPHRALMLGYLQSTECFTIYEGETGRQVAMFGHCVMEKGVSSTIWLLASTHLVPHKWTFLRESRKWLDHIHAQSPLLYNVVDQRNVMHLRWIEWLGFRFIRVIPEYGFQKLPFVEFAKV